MNGWTDRRTEHKEWMERQMDRQTDEQNNTNWMERQMVRQKDK